MTKTTNYQLPKWEKTDRIQMKDFNDMTASIDTALAGAAKIAVGTYEGTGTCGSANPNTLTFDFVPKLVWVKELGQASLPTLMISGDSKALSCTTNSGGGVLSISFSGNGVSWYHTGENWTPSSGGGNTPNEFRQLNDSDRTYLYLAIG